LRDLVSVGAIDRVYVHSPDRLARNYAYQVVLIDEWRRRGVELVFLNRPLGQSPEDDLLLQVQGIVAEYERAKIMERSRRGKKHVAQRGSVNVMSGAPFGYRYVSVQEGGGQARFEPVPEQARIVTQIFAWVAQDRCSLSEVCRRLQKAGELHRETNLVAAGCVARSPEPGLSGPGSIWENAYDITGKGGPPASCAWAPVATTADQQASGYGSKGLGIRLCSSLD
jgi:hypothetical protein